MRFRLQRKLAFVLWGKRSHYDNDVHHIDILSLFNGSLKLTEVNTDLEIFNYFDDSILKIIETCGNEKLSEAKNLLRRVKTRNWYKHEVFVTDNVS